MIDSDIRWANRILLESTCRAQGHAIRLWDAIRYKTGNGERLYYGGDEYLAEFIGLNPNECKRSIQEGISTLSKKRLIEVWFKRLGKGKGTGRLIVMRGPNQERFFTDELTTCLSDSEWKDIMAAVVDSDRQVRADWRQRLRSFYDDRKLFGQGNADEPDLPPEEGIENNRLYSNDP